jgi:isopentenyl-diphosphate Delta-isomerase
MLMIKQANNGNDSVNLQRNKEMEYVILVDENDHECGVMEKMEAHELGLLHRAFSIFLFDELGNILLQQRAKSKYHSPELWTNACCSHPRPEEELLMATRRRLNEELNMECPLEEVFHFTYHATFENGLIEHEFDHVFFGSYQGTPEFNTSEVMAVKWCSTEWLDNEIDSSPNSFTPWFRIAWPLVKQQLNKMTK